MTILLVILLSIVFMPASYFIVGKFVQNCASRTEKVVTRDKDGKIVSEEIRPKPLLWCFVPENTTVYFQRKGNNAKETGKGSKATPGSGSAIFDMAHAVPGKILINKDNPDTKQWKLVDISSDENTERLPEETHRRGLFYYLYGAHWLGFFTELRTVKVREVRLSVDEEEMQKHNEAKKAWEKAGKTGEKPKEPEYREHVKDYETPFPYFSREHGVAIRGAETSGAFTLDFYTNSVYEETYPIRARTAVADPNATLSTFVEQSINNETGGHDPEYFLFNELDEKLTKGASVPDLKERHRMLIGNVEKEVRGHAEEIIGITLKKFVVYSIDMDEEMRQLLELQERTERQEQARILSAKLEVEVATQEAKKVVVAAEGERDAKKARNDAEADHVERVIKPLASLPGGPAIRFAEALEKLPALTHLTVIPGGTPVVPVGGDMGNGGKVA